MTRFFGKIGYAETAVEDPNQAGVWREPIIERSYFGDVVRTTRQLRDNQEVNNDLATTTSISLIADAYLQNSFDKLRYVCWMQVRWLVTDISVDERRLILSLGGVYHGPTPGT